MRILIETSPEAEICKVVGQDARNFFVKKPNVNTPVKVAKAMTSVLIEPWEAMKAKMEGKSVEGWTGKKWVDVTGNVTFLTIGIYRLTPEPPKPKYAPFAHEDWEVFTKKPVRLENGNSFLINVFNERVVYTIEGPLSYAEALESLEFIDGTPFGKEISQ